MSQHVSASERLSRNPRHPNDKPDPRPRPPSPRFRHAPLAAARRPAQPTSERTSRLSRAARNEQPESKPPDTRTTNPTPDPPDTLTTVSTRPTRFRSRVGSTSFGKNKPVEPGREERAARVETTRHPNNKPDPRSPRHPHHGFGTACSTSFRVGSAQPSRANTFSATFSAMLSRDSRAPSTR